MIVREQARFQHFGNPHQTRVRSKIDICTGAVVDRQLHFARTLELIQNFQTATAALAFCRIVRIREQLQLIQNKSRHNQRATEKSSSAKICDATINDDIGINDERLMLGRLTGEAHVRDDEREFVATAPHGQHHAEITKDCVNDELDRPLHRFRLITQNLRSHQQVSENQTE